MMYQDDVVPGSPKSTLTWISIEYDKKGKKKKNKIIHRQTSRQMEFIITKKDGLKQRKNEAGWNGPWGRETGQGREESN